MNKENEHLIEPGHELSNKSEDPFIDILHKIIRVAAKAPAVLGVRASRTLKCTPTMPLTESGKRPSRMSV